MMSFPPPSFGQNPHLAREWDSLSTRMASADGTGFAADISPAELLGGTTIDSALKQIEETGRKLSSNDPAIRSKAAGDIIQIYSCEANGLRHDIHYYAESLAANYATGSEQFAYAARLMVAAATTIGLAAQRADNRRVLNELQASLEAATSGLERAGRSDSDVLAVVLRRQLSWLFAKRD